MKAKAFKKKLDLNKTTVADLSREKMEKLKGAGVTILWTNCDKCITFTEQPWCQPGLTEGPYTNCLCPG